MATKIRLLHEAGIDPKSKWWDTRALPLCHQHVVVGFTITISTKSLLTKFTLTCAWRFLRTEQLYQILYDTLEARVGKLWFFVNYYTNYYVVKQLFSENYFSQARCSLRQQIQHMRNYKKSELFEEGTDCCFIVKTTYGCTFKYYISRLHILCSVMQPPTPLKLGSWRQEVLA